MTDDDVYQAYVRDNAERDHLARQVLYLSKALARRERDFQALAEAAVRSTPVEDDEPKVDTRIRCGNCRHFKFMECAWCPEPDDETCPDFTGDRP